VIVGGCYYAGSPAQREIPYNEGTLVQLNFDTGGTQAAAFDGVRAGQTRTGIGCARTPNATTGYIGKDWGSGVTKIITGIRLYGASDVGMYENSGDTSVNVELIGNNTNDPTGGVSLGTFSLTDPNNDTVQEKLSGFTATPYRYHWVKLPAGTWEGCFAEVVFLEG
jgi:hypothetical protein